MTAHRSTTKFPRTLEGEELRGLFKKLSEDLPARVRCQSLSTLEFYPSSEVKIFDEDIKNGVILWKDNQYMFQCPKDFLHSTWGPPGMIHFSNHTYDNGPASSDEIELWDRTREIVDDYFSTL